MLEFSEQAYPPRAVEDIRGLIPRLEKGRDPGDELRELLDGQEIAALQERAGRMVESGVHPRLNPEFNVPWPFV
jgi:hypothetical protein